MVTYTIQSENETLHIREWAPPDSPAVRVLIVHGLGEHSGRYAHVAEKLAEAGFHVWAADHRGHGRSTGRRGDIREYRTLVKDLTRVVDRLGGAEGLFVMAHSFGAQVVLKWIIGHQPKLAGAVLSAPWLRLALEPPAWKLAIAKIAARLAPRLRLPTGINKELLSRDHEFLRGLDPENLVHRGISVRMFYHAMSAADEVRLKAGEVAVPVLLLHGEKDVLISPDGSREFCGKIASVDKSLWIVPGARHETHNDTTRAEVMAAIIEWLRARTPAAG